MEITLSFKEARAEVIDALKAGRTPAIWGGPGIGKSALGREVAKQLQAPLYILDAPLLQPFDYAIAVPDHQNKKVVLYSTGFLPDRGPAVVLIEDLPHAKQYQQIPLLQIVHDRRIGNLHFPDDVYFIITGNRETDLAGVVSLISPLNNRLFHINMVADVDEWLIWAKSTEIHPAITGFLTYRPDLLYQNPEEGKKAWPTPRSWHMASDLIKVNPAASEKSLRFKLAGTVGDAAATVFMTWYKYLQNVDPAEILEQGKLPQTSDRGQIFATVQSVAGLIKAKGTKYIQKTGQNILNFFNWLPGEFKMSFLKELITYSPEGKANTTILIAVMNLSEIMSKYVLDIIQNQEN